MFLFLGWLLCIRRTPHNILDMTTLCRFLTMLDKFVINCIKEAKKNPFKKEVWLLNFFCKLLWFNTQCISKRNQYA